MCHCEKQVQRPATRQSAFPFMREKAMENGCSSRDGVRIPTSRTLRSAPRNDTSRAVFRPYVSAIVYTQGKVVSIDNRNQVCSCDSPFCYRSLDRGPCAGFCRFPFLPLRPPALPKSRTPLPFPPRPPSGGTFSRRPMRFLRRRAHRRASRCGSPHTPAFSHPPRRPEAEEPGAAHIRR